MARRDKVRIVSLSPSIKKPWSILLDLFIVYLGVTANVHCQTYSDGVALMNDKLVNGLYMKELRPLLDQTKVMQVTLDFFLMSIVEIDDVAQSFVVNGFLSLHWADEILAWDIERYNKTRLIHPLPENIWRPRMILLNTLNERDLFGDDKAPLFITYDGSVTWVPGSLFPTSCQLQMTKFPLDVQNCVIFISAMSHSVKEMRFESLLSTVRLDFYTTHGEWDLVSTGISASDLDTGGVTMSTVKISFKLKRRSKFMLINVILPTVFLSFLNLLVFIIPVESGEKIGYGITVLLALALLLSMVSTMLPRSSLTMPSVIIYLFILLILSMLTVIDTIVTIFLFHKQEKDEREQNAKIKLRENITKVATMMAVSSLLSRSAEHDQCSITSTSIANMTACQSTLHSLAPTDEKESLDFKEVEPKNSSLRHVNMYKLIGRHIDLVSLVVFSVVWIAVTLGFLIDIAES